MKAYLLLPPCVLLAASILAQASPFTPGNLVLSRVGDGIAPLNNTSGPLTLLEISPTGTWQQSVSISTQANSGLQVAGTAISEGALSLSLDRSTLSLAGYLPPTGGTGILSGRTDTDAKRAYTTISSHGEVTTPQIAAGFSRESLRSAVVGDHGVYLAGSNTTASGGILLEGDSNTQIQHNANARVLNFYNDQLLFSSASGTRGIYTFQMVPTLQSTPVLLIDMGASASPYDFVMNPSGNVLYATDGSFVRRYSFNGSAWSLSASSNTIGSSLTGLEVEFNDSSDTIYTCNSGSLYSLSFHDSTFSSASVIANAGANYAFRGLSFTPIPELSSSILVFATIPLLLRRSRLR